MWRPEPYRPQTRRAPRRARVDEPERPLREAFARCVPIVALTLVATAALLVFEALRPRGSSAAWHLATIALAIALALPPLGLAAFLWREAVTGAATLFVLVPKCATEKVRRSRRRRSPA